ncbi:MAG: hypothetical protein Q8Q01_05500 [archaeon]|nr:hypothetical protein [archaeon]
MKLTTPLLYTALTLSPACTETTSYQKTTVDATAVTKPEVPKERTIDDLVNMRKQEARDKKIGEKATVILHLLGEIRVPPEFYAFEAGSLRMECESSAFYAGGLRDHGHEIKYNGELVFSDKVLMSYDGVLPQETSVQIYNPKPGDWEKRLEEIYQSIEVTPEKIEESLQKGKRKLENDKQRELIKLYGLEEYFSD